MAQTACFQGNNAEVQNDIIEAISNLVNVTIADRESMATLTQTIIHLTEELTKTQENLVAVLTALAEANKKTKDGTKPVNIVTVSYNHY